LSRSYVVDGMSGGDIPSRAQDGQAHVNVDLVKPKAPVGHTTPMRKSTLLAIASTASFVAAAASFFGTHPGLGAFLCGNGALFIALSMHARRGEARPQ
jgi:hypothetical protein